MEELSREVTSVFNVTPENEFCLTCTKKNCNGKCKEYQEFTKAERRRLGLTKKGGRQKGKGNVTKR